MGKIKNFYHAEINSQEHELTKISRENTLPEGYAEYQFLTAFDALCKQYGGFGKGKDKAFELIREQSLQ